MTGKPNQQNEQKLDDIVQDADEYYMYLKQKHLQQTRLDAIDANNLPSFLTTGLSL